MNHTQVNILLQVVGKYDREYRVYGKQELKKKLAEIRTAMIVAGDEYYVFLVMKPDTDCRKMTESERKKAKKCRLLP